LRGLFWLIAEAGLRLGCAGSGWRVLVVLSLTLFDIAGI